MPWHGLEWTHLNEQLVAGQLPHALLLVGAQYSGKSQLALALARRLLCFQEEGSLNCGQCRACELSGSGGHGDFRWVAPEENSRVIKVDQVRGVVQFSNKTAGFGLRKVIVLAPADALNANAFNALLKSLEEPAEDTYFILVCHRMYGVPATIRSRCQIVRVEMPDVETCLDWLDKTTGKRQQSEVLLSLADGRPLLAQHLSDAGNSEEFAVRRKGIEALLSGRLTLPQARDLWGEVDVDIFLEYLITDLQRLSSSLSLGRLRTKHGRAVLGILDEVFRLRRIVSSGANPSKQLMVEAILSKICRELGADLLGDNISHIEETLAYE